MAQKVNPISLRLPFNRQWDSVWFDRLEARQALTLDFYYRQCVEKTYFCVFDSNFICRIGLKNYPYKVCLFISLYDFKSKAPKTQRPQKIQNLETNLKKTNKKIVSRTVKTQNSFMNFLNFVTQERLIEISQTYVWRNCFKSAQSVMTIIRFHLEERKPYYEIIKKISFWCQKQKGDIGIKIQLKGRLTKFERSIRKNFEFKRIPRGCFSEYIDYSCDSAKTKAGLVGIKVWLRLPPIYLC